MSSRPPSGISPKEFFESWLPAEFERVRSELKTTPPDATTCVELTGNGGGVWTLSMARGALTVTPTRTDPANITLKLSAEDWQAVSSGAAQGEAVTPSTVLIDKLLTSPALGQILGNVRGTLRFEIPGFQGRTFSVEVTFQGAASPHATISIHADTLDQIRAGTLPIPQAFMAGKIQLGGDTGFAMQVGMAVLTPGP